MTVETNAPDITEIRAAIEARMQELRPLVEEHDRLEKAEAALERAMAKLNGGRRAVPSSPSAEADVPAPYGYKADGTPRKRPAPSYEDMQRRWATRRANAEAA